ncbi:rhodanese-like domain-containing protein [Pseudomonas stutzeri]|nr:rhodanese-like domain-containing protein [Stutzerimonas stutzeri]
MSAFSDLPLLIEPAELASRLDAPELILVDLTPVARYAEGHIPGARHVDTRRTQLGQPPAPGLLPEWSDFQALLGELGHRPEAVYVLYDDEGGPWAGRFGWLLDLIGHRTWHHLNGGLQAWLADGRELSTELPAAVGGPVAVRPVADVLASREYLLEHLHDDKLLIWDARSPEEYRGEKVLAARGGHIPGAVNLEWTDCLDRRRALRLRTDLAELLAARGIGAEREIVTHCQTHRRSGLTYLAMRALGYPNIKAYAGSWSEWGNHPDTPVER